MPLKYTHVLFILLAFSLASCKERVKETTDKYKHLVNKDPEELTYEELYNRTLTLWDVPFEEVDYATSYGTAHVIITGPENGKPLVLLHGMNSSSTVWYPNIKALSKDHRVYAIDFILEPGKSTLKKELEDVENIVDWYYEVFDHLKLDKLNLAGASLGGWLAVNIAIKNPTRINKLLLLSPVQTFTWIRPGEKAFKNMFFGIDPKKENIRKILSTIAHQVDKINQLYIDQYYRAITTEESNGLMMKMKPLPNDELRSLTMPTLLLIGDDDFANSTKTLNDAEKLLPAVTTKKLDHCRHFLTIDKTKEVNQLMIDFLKE